MANTNTNIIKIINEIYDLVKRALKLYEKTRVREEDVAKIGTILREILDKIENLTSTNKRVGCDVR